MLSPAVPNRFPFPLFAGHMVSPVAQASLELAAVLLLQPLSTENIVVSFLPSPRRGLL